jgi:hypothetical protein
MINFILVEKVLTVAFQMPDDFDFGVYHIIPEELHASWDPNEVGICGTQIPRAGALARAYPGELTITTLQAQGREICEECLKIHNEKEN